MQSAFFKRFANQLLSTTKKEQQSTVLEIESWGDLSEPSNEKKHIRIDNSSEILPAAINLKAKNGLMKAKNPEINVEKPISGQRT
jgi:hypothetical protein